MRNVRRKRNTYNDSMEANKRQTHNQFFFGGFFIIMMFPFSFFPSLLPFCFNSKLTFALFFFSFHFQCIIHCIKGKEWRWSRTLHACRIREWIECYIMCEHCMVERAHFMCERSLCFAMTFTFSQNMVESLGWNSKGNEYPRMRYLLSELVDVQQKKNLLDVSLFLALIVLLPMCFVRVCVCVQVHKTFRCIQESNPYAPCATKIIKFLLSVYTNTNKNSLHLYTFLLPLCISLSHINARGLIFFTLFIFPSNPRHRNKYSILSYEVNQATAKEKKKISTTTKNAPREHTHTLISYTQTDGWEFLFGGFRRILKRYEKWF